MADFGFRADRGKSRVELERIARRTREMLELDPYVPLIGLHLFENLPRYAFPTFRGIDTITCHVGDDLPAGSFAETRYEVEEKALVVKVTSGTYDELEAWNPHGTFTVAHEIGHIVLHTDELLRLAHIPHGGTALYRATRRAEKAFFDVEWQANNFAAAFLMPARALRRLEQQYGGIMASMVGDHFGVSLEAATYRLERYKEKSDVLCQ